MSYVTTCFYCAKHLKLRESVLVKDSLSQEIKHRYHPDCYLKLTEPIAQQRLDHDRTLEQMRNARNTTLQAYS